MNDQDLLVQRFLDQELEPDERVTFLHAVDTDQALRRRWLNLELVIAEASRLPRIVPSVTFLNQVKAQISPEPTLWARLWSAVMVSRTLEWNVAGAMAAACVVIVALSGVIRLTPERIVDVSMAVQHTPTASRDVMSEPRVFVRLVLLQPTAESVSIAGDFNGWSPTKTKLDRTDGGMWTVTLPLKPGRYEYMFVVDGKEWVADPLAAEETTDGFGAHNAVLDVAI